MADKSEQEKSTIKIVDRRRFDSTGEEKPEGSDSPTEVRSAEKTASLDNQGSSQKNNMEDNNFVKSDDYHESKTDEDQPEAQIEHEGDISFGSFVLSMATQAMMLLGQLKPPDGIPLAIDPAAAKQSIDILSMLEAKTRGNLTAQENQLLKDALHNLKIAYLRFR